MILALTLLTNYVEARIPSAVHQCARQFEDCECIGLVYYTLDDDNAWKSNQTLWNLQGYNYSFQDVRGSIQCSNDFFEDPLPGSPKRCWCSPHETHGYTNYTIPKYCAISEGFCKCNGVIYYGYDKVSQIQELMWLNYSTYLSSGTTWCSPLWEDPLLDYNKGCYCAEVFDEPSPQEGEKSSDSTSKGVLHSVSLPSTAVLVAIVGFLILSLLTIIGVAIFLKRIKNDMKITYEVARA